VDSAEVQHRAAAVQDEEFTLVAGGALFQLLRRLGVIDETLHRLPARIALIVGLTWLPLLALTSVERNLYQPAPDVSFLGDIECQARFLVAVPLLMIAEWVVHLRMRPLVAQFRARGLVRREGLEGYAEAVRRAHRLRNSVLAEIVLLAVVFVSSILSGRFRYAVAFPVSWYVRTGGHQLSYAGLWFVFVSLPIFQFLLARWGFRLVIWTLFLFRVARLPLRPEALHPDKAGGLAFLGATLTAYIPLAAALGVIVSGALADQILYAGAQLINFKMVIGAAAAAALTVFAGPLLMFVPILARTRRAGLLAYGRVGETYARSFREKWIDGPGPADEPLLGTGDIQSLADLGNSYAVAEQMRVVPLTRAGVVEFLFAFLAPIVPLVLTVMSIEKLLQTLVKMVL
jgi:hypothetical protein